MPNPNKHLLKANHKREMKVVVKNSFSLVVIQVINWLKKDNWYSGKSKQKNEIPGVAPNAQKEGHDL